MVEGEIYALNPSESFALKGLPSGLKSVYEVSKDVRTPLNIKFLPHCIITKLGRCISPLYVKTIFSRAAISAFISVLEESTIPVQSITISKFNLSLGVLLYFCDAELVSGGC